LLTFGARKPGHDARRVTCSNCACVSVVAERFARSTRLEIDLRVEPDLPDLHREAELVIYRVAQEALTNVARHSG